MSIVEAGRPIPASGGLTMPLTKRRYIENSTDTSHIPHILPIKEIDSVLSIVKFPAGKVVHARNFLGDFYYRIWVLPNSISALSPKSGDLVYFKIWNGFLHDNPLSQILRKGTQATTLDLKAGRVFRMIEIVDVSLKIVDDKVKKISEIYTFQFRDGTGTFSFEAVIARKDLTILPEKPFNEIWQWKTTVLKNIIGGEQRIACRQVPRRLIETSFTILEEDVRKHWNKHLTDSIPDRFNLPLPQYSCRMAKDSPAGSYEIFFPPEKTDIRVDEPAYIAYENSYYGITVNVRKMTDTGALLKEPLGSEVKTGMTFYPMYPAYYDGHPVKKLYSLFERVETRLAIDAPRKEFIRPNTNVPFIWCDEMIALEHRPLTNSPIDQTFVVDMEKVDNLINEPLRRSFYYRSFSEMKCEFLIQRMHNSIEMDWWREFLYLIRGSQKRFLMPTWKVDLELAEPSKGDEILVVKDTDYFETFYTKESFQYLWLHTKNGFQARHIKNATITEDSNTQFELHEEIGLQYIDIREINIMYRARLNNDNVTIQHNDFDSIIVIGIQSVDE